jgi:hypothetical protein
VLGAVVAASALFALWWASRSPEPATAPRAPLVEKAAAANPVSPLQEAEPEPERPPEKEPSRPTTISVSESALGTGVVSHVVTGRGNRFSEGERVLFLTRVLAAKPGDVIHHYWLHEGRAVMRANLRIGGPHWRTFSRYTLPKGSSGTWVVEARDDTGRVLAREEFLCLEQGG